MRSIAVLSLFVLLTGCVPPVTDSLRRSALPPGQAADVPAAMPALPPTSPSALGYGGAPPLVPSAGLGPEAPMPMPKAAPMPKMGASGASPAGMQTAPAAGGQSIVVPNGNGTSTIIHPDGTVETVPTAK